MSYTFSEQQQIQILSTDSLWIPEDNQRIIESLQALIAENKCKFIIDLSNCSYINSIGLSFLISILTRARSAGGEVILCGISDKVRQLLLLTRLQSMFTVTESVEEALDQFNLTKA
jgi:anti-sigma B factor antagonist